MFIADCNVLSFRLPPPSLSMHAHTDTCTCIHTHISIHLICAKLEVETLTRDNAELASDLKVAQDKISDLHRQLKRKSVPIPG